MDGLRRANEESDIECLRRILLNEDRKTPLAMRFRALFNLKALGSEGSEEAVKVIAEGFDDESELLKHELAYVLGQTKQKAAIQPLQDVLKNHDQQLMVRHEAAEALGAIGDTSSLPLLKQYYGADPSQVIRQTCELAIDRIQWEQDQDSRKHESLTESAYTSIDPAPPLPNNYNAIEQLQELYNDQSKTLFQRYRAMFRLRDLAQSMPEAIAALASGFKDPSALFRHEIAYVFGQLCSPLSVPFLVQVLDDPQEEAMVRHEAAEALGSIASEDVLPILKKYASDQAPVVKDSALVALDMYEFENSDQVDYTAVV